MPYLLMPNTEKAAWLMNLAAEDDIFAPIADDLQSFGYDIAFPFWGESGSYTPYALYAEEHDGDFEESVLQAHKGGELKAQFRISPRYGRSMNAHYWLHELMHFYQDLNGMFLTPLRKSEEMSAMLDARSTIMLTLFCEAMAETEAIRASWRLREKGRPEAWRGAMISPDWSKLARQYAADVQSGIVEAEAARACFERWYSLSLRPFYERSALKRYELTVQGMMADAGMTDLAEIYPYLRTLRFSDLLGRLPSGDFDHMKIAKIHGPAIVSKKLQSRLDELEHEIGACSNGNVQDVEIGAPPYIWNMLRHRDRNSTRAA